MAAPTISLSLRTFAPDDPGSWDRLFARAMAADAAGVDRVVVPDHVAFGERLDEYGRPEVGGTVGGQQPTGPDGHWLEPLTALSFIAARTTRVRVMTGILIAALRRPIVLAKVLSTMDVLSEGRVDLGVGVGWQREEYEAAGLSFDGRGALLDETLAVLQSVWRDADAALDVGGRVVEHIHQMPKPAQPGGVPIWVSGRMNRNVVARVVRFGAGWIPWGDDATDPRPGIARLREAMAASGRDGDQLLVTASLPDDLGAVPALIDAGVTDFRINRRVGDDELAALVDEFRQTSSRA